MMPKECQAACDFRCNQAPELDLECETCPGRNEAKPMPGGGERPRWRAVFYDIGMVFKTSWFEGDVWRLAQQDVNAHVMQGRVALIQFERKNGMC